MKLLIVDSDSCASSETEQQQLLQQSTWTQSTIVFELGALADNWRSTTEWTNATALRTIKVVALIMTKPFSQNAAIPLLFPMIKKTHRQPVGGFNLEFWTYHKWVMNLFSKINFREVGIYTYLFSMLKFWPKKGGFCSHFQSQFQFRM